MKRRPQKSRTARPPVKPSERRPNDRPQARPRPAVGPKPETRPARREGPASRQRPRLDAPPRPVAAEHDRGAAHVVPLDVLARAAVDAAVVV
jgi:hypothetical protein